MSGLSDIQLDIQNCQADIALKKVLLDMVSAGTGDNTPIATGVELDETTGPTLHHLTITMNEVVMSVDGSSYIGHVELSDFSLGLIQMMMAKGSFTVECMETRSSHIHVNAVLHWSLGTVAIAADDFSTTDCDSLIPQTSVTLSQTGVGEGAQSPVTIAGAFSGKGFDGTTTGNAGVPVKVFLNFAFPTHAQLGATSTLHVDGTFELVHINFGDF